MRGSWVYPSITLAPNDHISQMIANKLNFSGHQTFTLRYAWIPKAVEALGQGVNLLAAEEAMMVLGVGKNMVNSIVHWLQATEIAHRYNGNITLTAFGDQLCSANGFDPYLEDIASLWLLHWKVAARREPATTCYWLFNILRTGDFKERNLLRGLEQWITQQGKTLPSSSTLKRDMDCYLRAYVPPSRGLELDDWIDSPLGELGIISTLEEIDNEKWYRFATDAHKTLPDWVLRYAIDEYWFNHAPSKELLSFDDVTFGEGSPGMVFKIGPDAMIVRLEALDEDTHLALVESNGVRNLVRRSILYRPEIRNYHTVTA